MNFSDVMVQLNFGATLLCLVVALVAVRYREISASRRVAALLMLAGTWALTEALIATLPLPEQKFRVLYLQYAAVTFIPLVWIAVALAVTGGPSLPKRVWPALIAVSSAFAVLYLTNPWHGLMLEDVHLEPNADLPVYGFGALFVPYALYAYALLGYGTLRIFEAWRDARGVRRFELGLWLVCLVIPAATDLVSFAPGTLPYQVKLTPLALALSAALAGWGLVRRQMFVTEPVALERAFHSMRDAVLIVDANNRVALVNEAASAFTWLPPDKALGMSIERVLPEWSEMAFDEPFEVSVERHILEYSASRVPSGGFVVIVRDLTALRNYEQQLLEAAMRDPLTELYNRRAFLERGKALLKSHGNACIVYLDLDRFKLVNDRHGHEAGDALLKTVADRLALGLEGHLLARVGGDEFVALIALPLPTVRELMARLEERVAESASVHGLTVNVGLSWGVAVYPRDGSGLEGLLRAADTQMYTQKRARKAVDIVTSER
jgi:diguanylate cyclase (GGDEF)-like protein